MEARQFVSESDEKDERDANEDQTMCAQNELTERHFRRYAKKTQYSVNSGVLLVFRVSGLFHMEFSIPISFYEFTTLNVAVSFYCRGYF